MKKSRILFACAVAVVSALLISGMANAKPAPGTFNVTITVYDTDASGAPTHIGSDDFNGNGYAVYSSSSDPGTATNVFEGKQLFLDLWGQSNRTLYINADDPLPGSPAGPAPGKYWQNVEFYTGCWDANNNLIPLQTITTSYGNCRTGVNFTSNGTKYKFDMGPNPPAPGPATGSSYVQCNTISAGQCVNWTVTPNLNSPTPRVANLYLFGTKGLSFLHQYYNSYRIGISKP
ncbi:hypothetical protein [Occallatibacter savannae]|uniref:hypothetical protein n=1 Tax=Occallatibacter savannae TaxID=1002691 RepID=UPI000D693C46|nr:hypothetical protein [Occallatibacter savannae]